MTETLPYRFEGTDQHAGWTFIYYPGHLVVSFATAEPEVWYETTGLDPADRVMNSRRHAMTAEKLAEFRSVPKRAEP